MNNKKEQVRDDFGGGGSGAAAGHQSNKNDSRDYGKWALVATAIVLAAVAAVLWMI